MASVAVEMTAPNGKVTAERSNLAGFVNFPMSVSKRSAVIRRPGDYVFRVVVPPGWIVTSANQSQTARFQSLPGAPADLVAADPTHPVGLAPELFIAGRLATRNARGALVPMAHTTVHVRDPNGAMTTVATAEDGAFTIPAARGTWELFIEAADGTVRAARRITVRDAPVRASAMILDDRAGEQALRPPVVVDFESVTETPVAKIPSGTAGLDWNYLNAIDAVFAGHAGYVNTLASGHYVGYSSSGHPVTVSLPAGFDFLGAYFGAALTEAEGETLRVQAFRGGVPVGEEEFTLSSLGPVWFDAEYRNVDRVVFTTLHYWQFVTDDMLVGILPTPARERRTPTGE
jgi:hypothetical protein